MGQPQPGAEAGKKETVRAFIDALNRQDLRELDALLAEDATWTISARNIPGSGVHSKKELLETMLPSALNIFREGEPRTEILSMLAEGDTVCAESVSLGHLRNGTEYNNHYAHVFEVRDGRIAAIREYNDSKHAAEVMAEAVAAGLPLDLGGGTPFQAGA
ncbi:nuclear transport factor 2 family protein [Streptomyces sp. NPDC048172]|uniref:nuclear transport factor 2 family protein n=1 Tax=Streptomyces sp. NPDC048172 TaxID=3365505 RepID=UPI003718DB44